MPSSCSLSLGVSLELRSRYRNCSVVEQASNHTAASRNPHELSDGAKEIPNTSGRHS